MNIEKNKAQMRRGVLEMCVLAIISREEVYPSEIINHLKDTELIVVEGTLYPLLNRLKKEGYVKYNWQESTSGPPRKYFQITTSGALYLDKMNKSWTELVYTVNNFIITEPTQTNTH